MQAKRVSGMFADLSRRMRALGAIGVLLAGALGTVTPSVRAANGVPSGTAQPAGPVDLNTGEPASPIPYQFPNDGGSVGQALRANASIALRPTFVPAIKPNQKTAVESAWSRDKRVWANPDGTYTLEAGPSLNYIAANGTWAPIDLTLAQVKDGIWKPTAAASNVQINQADSTGSIATLTGDLGAVSIRLATPSTGALAGNALKFAGSGDTPQIFIRPSDEGVEFGATLADASVTPTVSLILDPGPYVPVLGKDGRTIDLSGTTKDQVIDAGSISAPAVFDDARQEAPIDDVKVALATIGDGTYALTYEISATWLAAKERTFPVTFDPTVCVQSGNASCQVNTGVFDIWYGSGLASSYVTSSSTVSLHTGLWQSGGSNDWKQTRSVMYFPGASLPDGAMVTGATLDMRETFNYSGATTARIYARMVNKTSGWTVDTSSASWNSLQAAVNTGYDSPQYAPCDTGGTDCTISMDVTNMARAWYTRRGPDWQPNIGIQLRYATEGTTSPYYETLFYRDNDGTTSNRPKLTITYEVPAFELTFDPALGPTYAPSTMIAGQSTLLPISIKNDSSYTWDTTNYRIGYRWYDVKGNVVGSPGLISLSSAVNSGATYTPNPAPSITPPGLGQYTLRFDMVKVVSGVNLFASDWAQPSKYYSRNKKILTSDSTRWTGSSPIERDEFPITVRSGQGAGADPKSVGVAGGVASIDLLTHNLAFNADSGLGVKDMIPFGLTYGYNSKDAPCTGYQGVLGACGWYTNYDERVTAGTANGDYTYTDAQGNDYLTDSDFDGQLIGAPNNLSRYRATLFDENRPTSGGTLVTTASETPSFTAESGTQAVKVAANTTTTLAGFVDGAAGREVSLNTFRWVQAYIRTTTAAVKVEICFTLDDKTKGSTYVVCFEPNGDWDTSHDRVIGGTSPVNNWVSFTTDLWGIESGVETGWHSGGNLTDDFYLKTVQVIGDAANTGSIYIDKVTLTPRSTMSIWGGTNVTNWDSGSATSVQESWDSYYPLDAIALPGKVTCSGTCLSSKIVNDGSTPIMQSLTGSPFMSWWWKKAGGTVASMAVTFQDMRQGSDGGTGYKSGTITYYAGSAPPADAPVCPGTTTPCVIQVSPTLPGHMTRVERNLLEDARQVLNMFNDAATGSSSTSPPTSGPMADDVKITAFSLDPVDGQYLSFARLYIHSGALPPILDRFGNQYDDHYNDTVNEHAWNSDFMAEMPDGTSHFFNRDGILTKIVDKNENELNLEWSYGAGSGQANYTLVKVHGTTDNTMHTGQPTYVHNLSFTTTTLTGFRQVTVTENLGSTTTPITGRRADFEVATSAQVTAPKWNAGDLVRVSPARHVPAALPAAACGSHPSGCLEFEYTDATGHVLKRVADPRWDGLQSGGNGGETEITWTGSDPTAILDLSHASASLLRVLSFDSGRTTSPNYVRALWQDAPAIAANYAIHEDLSPEGNQLTGYIRQACTGAPVDCTTSANWPAGDGTTLGARKSVSHSFDGLSDITSTTTYRCPSVVVDGCTGGTALATLTRSATNASAKVENFVDALASGRVMWTQTADQYFASMRDSGGTNPDLYRTNYTYNGVGLPTVTTSPVFNRVTDYAGTMKGTEGLGSASSGYWRLNETSGNFADSSGSNTMTASGTLSYLQAGPLARDTTNKAVGFNGSNAKATANVAINQTAYTIEAWVKPSSASADMLIAGRWSANSGARLFQDASGGFAFSHNATTISTATAGWEVPLATYPNRWYYVVATWDGARMRLYVDGDLIVQAGATGSTGQPSGTFNIGSYGTTGYYSGSIDEVVLRDAAIDQSVVHSHLDAGLGIALPRTETSYDIWEYNTDGNDHAFGANPAQTATSFIANGSFEEGLSAWNTNHGAVLIDDWSNGSFRPNDEVAAVSLTGASNYTDQVAQLVPGQRFHFQLAGEISAAPAQATYRVDYWKISTASWQPLIPEASITTTSWSTAAFEYTVPAFDTTGLLKVTLRNGGGSAFAYFDSVLLVAAWQAWQYANDLYNSGGSAIDCGLVTQASTLSAAGTIRVDTYDYVNEPSHQKLFPTTIISNYLDGTQGPGPEEDVTTRVTYDSWGRPQTSTDPDGVVTTTVYDSTNLTDIVQTKDGLNNTTTMTYDAVGNHLTTTSPLGRVTSATYDLRNHQLTSTAPDGIVARTDYDNYGRVSASWSNYVNGVVESTDGDTTDDVQTTYAYDAYGRVTQQDVDCGAAGSCTSNGGLDARTTMGYDLLGNLVSKTVYPGAGGTGTARTTTNYFETTSSSPTLSRTAPSGVQLPIAPTASPAPLCPGSATAYCSSASVWKWNGSSQSAIDMNGRSFATTDAYGIVTVNDADIEGRPVITTAGYDASVGASSDANVVTRTEYAVTGDPIVNWDAAGRRDVRTYDALGRLLEVDHLDSAGSQYLRETRQYLPSGRLAQRFDGSASTGTVYDGAGRAVKTIANWDQNGNAGMTLDAFEGDVSAWKSTSSSFFTTSAAATAPTTDISTSDPAANLYSTVAPESGRGRLHVTTHATNTNDGVWLDISGPTYQSGHTYKATFDVMSSAAVSLTAYLGQDVSGGSYGSNVVSSTTAWTRPTVSWTPGSNLSTPIHFAVTKATSGTAELYLDNLVIWDSTAGSTDKGIVSSLTSYDADGEIIATAMPPGDPATERPLVTDVAFDAAGRTVESVTNGISGAYSAAVLTTANLAAYFPLSERLGINVADKTGGTSLVSSAIPTLGIAGGIDEPRTATRFTGANGYFSRGSNATSNTTNVSMEAWIRSDTTPSGTVIVGSNGTSSDSWGIAIDASGNAAGFTQKSTNPQSGFNTLSSPKNVTDGSWHHVVLTRGASTWAMTVDGTSQTLSNNTKNPGTPGASFTIGAWSDGTRIFVGEVNEVSVYTVDISGSTASAHWAAGRRTDATTGLTTRNTYDRLGRVTDAWAPDLVRTKAVYDRLGDQTDTWANYRDGVTTGGTADDDVHSTYAYDVANELIGYCPAVQVKVGGCDPTSSTNAQAWHYAFDPMGRQTKTIPPVNTSLAALTTSETVYEAGGRIGQTCQYPAGTSCGSTNSRHVDYAYDNLGRPLTKKTWDRTSGSDTLKFTKTLAWNADGSPASAAEGSTTLSYVYDNAGRLSQFKNGATVLTAYTYTPDTSTTASRTDGTLGTTAFTYDWARRETVIDPPDSYVTGTVTRTYRLDGLLATQSFPSSIAETLGYDEDKRPVSINLNTSGTASSLTQAFDRAGRATSDGRSLTGISGDAGTGTQSFSYDNLSRLTGSTGLAVSRSYAYDLDGNRTSRVEGSTTTSFTYDRTDETINQTIGATTKTYTYDAFGNLTTSADNQSSLTIYAYDEASRLSTISPPGGSSALITFTVDPLDRNATRAVGGTTTDAYGYVGSARTVWQTGNASTSSLLDADGSRLAVKTGSTVSWLVFDLHGSVTALCPAGSSSVSDAYRFDGFGQQIAAAGSATNPYRYRGLLNLTNSWDIGALLAMGARDYAPQLGQFSQLDSVQGSAANPLTMNRFLYALADPATLVDPDGHETGPLDESGGFGGEIGIGDGPGEVSISDGAGATMSVLNIFGAAVLVSGAAVAANLVSHLLPRLVARIQASGEQKLVRVDDIPERIRTATDTANGWDDVPKFGGGKPFCTSIACRVFVGGVIGTAFVSPYLLMGIGADDQIDNVSGGRRPDIHPRLRSSGGVATQPLRTIPPMGPYVTSAPTRPVPTIPRPAPVPTLPTYDAPAVNFVTKMQWAAYL